MDKKKDYEDFVEFVNNIKKKRGQEYLIYREIWESYESMRDAYIAHFLTEQEKKAEENSKYKGLNKKFRKFLGSMTTEIIRKYLAQKFNLSQKDVFIKGLSSEIDLLLLKKNVDNKKILYEFDEVLAILEIKFRGPQSKEGIIALKKMYDTIKKIKPSIECIYIAIQESEKYKYKITKFNSGFDVFELFYYTGNIVYGEKKNTKNWDKLIAFLKK